MIILKLILKLIKVFLLQTLIHEAGNFNSFDLNYYTESFYITNKAIYSITDFAILLQFLVKCSKQFLLLLQQ